uniref:Uncharacterized protein n=1 Tax=Schistocephalus solidus TaxID=70667 RepID=A0A0X3PH76_SCHSO
MKQMTLNLSKTIAMRRHIFSQNQVNNYIRRILLHDFHCISQDIRKYLQNNLQPIMILSDLLDSMREHGRGRIEARRTGCARWSRCWLHIVSWTIKMPLM